MWKIKKRQSHLGKIRNEPQQKPGKMWEKGHIKRFVPLAFGFGLCDTFWAPIEVESWNCQ